MKETTKYQHPEGTARVLSVCVGQSDLYEINTEDGPQTRYHWIVVVMLTAFSHRATQEEYGDLEWEHVCAFNSEHEASKLMDRIQAAGHHWTGQGAKVDLKHWDWRQKRMGYEERCDLHAAGVLNMDCPTGRFELGGTAYERGCEV